MAPIALSDTPATKIVSVPMPLSLADAVWRFAALDGERSASSVIRQAVAEYLADPKRRTRIEAVQSSWGDR
jgi:hypothetical protein